MSCLRADTVLTLFGSDIWFLVTVLLIYDIVSRFHIFCDCFAKKWVCIFYSPHGLPQRIYFYELRSRDYTTTSDQLHVKETNLL